MTDPTNVKTPTTSVISIRQAPKGWSTDGKHVYVGRQQPGLDGYFGNPYKLTAKTDPKERAEVIAMFERHARRRIDTDPEYREAVKGLIGKTLVCWCAPEPCHGDVLAVLAAELSQDPERQ